MVRTGGVVDYLWTPVMGGWAFDLGDLAIVGGGVALFMEAVTTPLLEMTIRPRGETTGDEPDLP
jgi:hypothetical protein